MGFYKYTSPKPGPKALKLIKEDSKVTFGAHTRTTEIPLVMDSAKGVYIKDADGKDFLDLGSGFCVASTGHCHPEVVKAIKDQAELLLHNPGSDFYYHTQTELAEKTSQTCTGRP